MNLKARARDVFFFGVFAVVLFNCTKEKQNCQLGWAPSRTMAPTAEEAKATAHDALVEMSCACAAGPELGDDCAEDAAGCARELDALLFCVEDGDACGDDSGEWACEAEEAAWRGCTGSPRKNTH
jgi:hypothetical protein